MKNPATERAHLRLTPAEKRRYQAAAKRAGLSLSAWLKNLAETNS